MNKCLAIGDYVAWVGRPKYRHDVLFPEQTITGIVVRRNESHGPGRIDILDDRGCVITTHESEVIVLS